MKETEQSKSQHRTYLAMLKRHLNNKSYKPIGLSYFLTAIRSQWLKNPVQFAADYPWIFNELKDLDFDFDPSPHDK